MDSDSVEFPLHFGNSNCRQAGILIVAHQDFPLWRKKVDSSLFNYRGTTIPQWACQIWGIEEHFQGIATKRNQKSKVRILFQKSEFEGWVTEAAKKRITPAYRLWYTDELAFKLKDSFLMSYMRDIESRLRKDIKNIEDEIPFWEFLDIEYDASERAFYFTAYYTQKASFPELFKRLVGSPALHKIDRELKQKDEIKIYKQDWKPRELFETEFGAENVVYMLVDTKKKLFYVGEAQNLIRRFNQGHTAINEWNYYRYDVLPKQFMKYRLEIERMLIRDFATIMKSKESISSIEISSYTMVNEKIDKL